MTRAKVKPVSGAIVTVAVFISGAAIAQAQPRPAQVQVQHAAARLVVLAEPRTDISVTVQHGTSRLPDYSVQRQAGRIVVDGGLGPRDHISCIGRNPRFGNDRGVVVNGAERVAFAELPQITVHVPLDARISAGGAIWGQVGATHSLVLSSTGCGEWTVGPVQAALSVVQAGSADVHAADAGVLQAVVAGSGDLNMNQVGGANLQISGSGDTRLTSVNGPLSVVVEGSADVTVGRVFGPVHAEITGSGTVRLQSGRAPRVQVATAGSGDFDFAGSADALSAASSGSGDIHLARVNGPISKTVSGSGEVRVGP